MTNSPSPSRFGLWTGKIHFISPARTPESYFYVFVIAHIAVWTLYPLIADYPVVLHHDMTEAWSWGKEFQLGYYKHPPLFAWIAGLWFHIFPRADGWFNLLSAVNVAAGLTGVWFMAGRFLRGWTRVTAVVLLALTPFYNVMAIDYNANAILLSMWPWMAYFFVRSFETGDIVHGAAFGALAAASLLCKYFSALLLASCFFASLLHPGMRRYYRTPAPYVAVLILAVLVAPHVWWLVESGWPTIHYAGRWLTWPYRALFLATVTTFAACAAFHALALATLVAIFRDGAPAVLKRGAENLTCKENHWLALLAFGPFALAILSGLFGIVKISPRFMIPVFFMMPLALLRASRVELSAAQFWPLQQILKFGAAVVIALSPFVAIAAWRYPPEVGQEPRRELAVEATRLWREAFATPLRITSGPQAYGPAMTFYSPDAPSDFTELRYDLAPWVSPDRIRREGLLIVCLEGDRLCSEQASRFATRDTRHVTLKLARTFEILLIPRAASESGN